MVKKKSISIILHCLAKILFPRQTLYVFVKHLLETLCSFTKALKYGFYFQYIISTTKVLRGNAKSLVGTQYLCKRERKMNANEQMKYFIFFSITMVP